LIKVETLAERIHATLRVEEFIEGAKCLWENLIGAKNLRQGSSERDLAKIDSQLDLN
jgi:hypothetical protein